MIEVLPGDEHRWRMLKGAGLTSLSNQYTASEGQRNLRAFEKYIRYVKKLEGVAN